MGTDKIALVVVATLVGLGLGWAAAMYVNAGPPLRDADDAYERFQNALAGTDTLTRSETLVKLTKKLTPETLPGAVRAYKEDLWPRENSDVRILMAYWARQDPYGMVTEVFGWNNLRIQQIAVNEAMDAIAEREPWEDVRKFYDGMPTHARKSSLVNLSLRFVDHADVRDLPAFITSFDDHEERDLVGEITIERMIDNFGPKVLQEWVEGLPDGKGNTSDLKVVAFRAASRAHMDNGYRAELEDWLMRVGQESWTKGGWRSMAVNLAKTDPVGAIEWARGLPDEADRLNVVQEAVRVFALRDVDAAVPWLLSQPPSKELDRGTGVLVIHFMGRDPDQSLVLLERIVGLDTFRNTVRTATAFWKKMGKERRDAIFARIDEIAEARPDKGRDSGKTAGTAG